MYRLTGPKSALRLWEAKRAATGGEGLWPRRGPGASGGLCHFVTGNIFQGKKFSPFQEKENDAGPESAAGADYTAPNKPAEEFVFPERFRESRDPLPRRNPIDLFAACGLIFRVQPPEPIPSDDFKAVYITPSSLIFYFLHKSLRVTLRSNQSVAGYRQ